MVTANSRKRPRREARDALSRAFPCDSELAQRMRAFDWEATEVGPPSEWPENLRVALAICLTMPVPAAIVWGPRLTLFYNDGFLPFLAPGEHPIALGGTPPKAVPSFWTAMGSFVERVLETGEAICSEQISISGQPSRACVAFSFGPLFGASGAVEGVFCACSESADRVASMRLGTLASPANDAFLAVLGHELRNPLAPIMTAVSLLRRQAVRTRELDIIERQAQHLARLVGDLLDVSRIARGKVTLEKERVELAAVLEAAVELSSGVLERRRNVLTVTVPSEGLPVDADRARLAQVFSNILVNASKYSEAGSRIEVDGMQVDDCVRLVVRDFGMGLSPELRSRIFEMFVQQPQALDRSSGGLGLGLAIARSLVQLHGGTITARSGGVGKGSEFVVDIPLSRRAKARSSDEHVPIREPRPPMPKGTRNRVLVVDDNEDAAELYATALVRVGYEVRTAFDGPSALAAARQFLPHICVLDIGLPVMNGYEVAVRLRQVRRDIRLIAITGYGQPSDKKRATDAGFDTHLTKPVADDELLGAIAGRPLLNVVQEDRERDQPPGSHGRR